MISFFLPPPPIWGAKRSIERALTQVKLSKYRLDCSEADAQRAVEELVDVGGLEARRHLVEIQLEHPISSYI